MSEISPKGPINPDDKKIYQSQFKESVNLFSDALEKYHGIENPNKTVEHKKKEMYKDVMDKTKHIMEETHTQMRKKAVEKNFNQLQKDYADLDTNQLEAYEKLKADIQNLKNSME